MKNIKVYLLKFKLFYLKLLGKIKKIDKRIEVNQNKTNKTKNILIIFPIKDEQFRVALYSLRNLVKKKNISYYYLINSIYKNNFHLNGHIYDLYHNVKKDKVEIDSYFNNEIAMNIKFDIIVDLNNEFVFDISYLINKMSGYYKVGFKNSYSDYFYNVQFDLKSFEILEDGYKQINNLLK
ncbi:hypothetical protein OAH62_00305 [Candidatus Marinimicrobia bacterium]|nr:hypothetical protein [Candidatus Neomarinimicrobiota bacterium]